MLMRSWLFLSVIMEIQIMVIFFRYWKEIEKRFKKNESSAERCRNSSTETEEWWRVKGYSQTVKESGQLVLTTVLLLKSDLNSSNTNGSFTMANSNSVLSLQNSLDRSRKQILKEAFLFFYEIVCCVYSLESPLQGNSNEYTQRTIIV